ncbi:MAG TPA: hypothetical protein VH351_21270 [Bryobacteraceae bacterium]|jgi:hypothetical protein|nr:hypothetical protein [Bryobacteraceae bacterium]
MNAVSSTRSKGFSFSLAVLLLILCFSSLGYGQDQPASANASQPGAPTASGTPPPAGPDNAWHADMVFYLWFAGAHGTINNGGQTIDFKASPSELIENLRFGLMGTVQAQRGRFVFINDLMWIGLRATNQRTLPLPGEPELSGEAKAREFILTPLAGYRVVDRKWIKLDALMLGFRYWHAGTDLQFSLPSFTGSFSKSWNWVDPLMGARILFPLSSKVVVAIAGDAGAWGGAKLDYEIVGAIGYKLSRKFTLNLGYRYLYIDYRPASDSIYQIAMNGGLIGFTYHFKAPA